jgi:hypothetical protein
MSADDDDEKAYTTYDDILGRSIRRGTRKAIKALTFGLVSDEPVSGALKNLAGDAARELPTAIERSSRSKDGD